jgi:hypothetical protein
MHSHQQVVDFGVRQSRVSCELSKGEVGGARERMPRWPYLCSKATILIGSVIYAFGLVCIVMSGKILVQRESLFGHSARWVILNYDFGRVQMSI